MTAPRTKLLSGGKKIISYYFTIMMSLLCAVLALVSKLMINLYPRVHLICNALKIGQYLSYISLFIIAGPISRPSSAHWMWVPVTTELCFHSVCSMPLEPMKVCIAFVSHECEKLVMDNTPIRPNVYSTMQSVKTYFYFLAGIKRDLLVSVFLTSRSKVSAILIFIISE